MTTTPAMPEQVWLMYAKKKPDLRRLSFANDLSSQEKANGWVSAPYALATLQAQPAAVSDAEIDEVWRQHHVLNEAFGEVMDAQAFEHAARAILALRPQAVPMTEEQLLHDFERECADTDKLLSMLGMNPDDVRTDGGSLNLPRIASLLGKTEVK